MMSTVVGAKDGKDVDPKVWTPAHAAIIKAAAKDAQVSRIFANPAIKKALCREAGRDRAWLRKVRVWYGHVITSMCGFTARRTVRSASQMRRLWAAMAAAIRISTGGSPMPRCIPSHPRRSLRCEWPTCLLPAGRCW
jgi:hypothetical protein